MAVCLRIFTTSIIRSSVLLFLSSINHPLPCLFDQTEGTLITVVERPSAYQILKQMEDHNNGLVINYVEFPVINSLDIINDNGVLNCINIFARNIVNKIKFKK